MSATLSDAVEHDEPPPGPSWTATPRLFRQLVRDRIALMTTAASYGDASRLVIGPKALYVFNHPDHAKHVLADNSANYHKGIGLVQARRALGDGLLTSEGERWRAQRRAIQPAFQAKRIADKAGVVAEEAVKLATRLRSLAGTGPVDIGEEMTALTLGVLGRVLLDTELTGAAEIGHAFEAVQDHAMFEMVSLSMVPQWLPLPEQVRFRLGRRQLHRIVDRLAEHRLRHPGAGQDDVLTRVLDSVRGISAPDARQRVRDELVTLLLAGHETTASTLSWTFHLLDRHPGVWQRVHDEAVAVLGDRAPVHEDLRGLRYTTAVVSEVLRLYPPVWGLTRIAQAPDRVGGYRVPAGADVMICPYTLHRHPEFWPEPGRFDPDRFGPDAPADRPSYAYLPFGAGPRFCVGNHLGLMEAVFVTAVVARELRLTGVPGRAADAEAMLSLRVRGGLPMTIHPLRGETPG